MDEDKTRKGMNLLKTLSELSAEDKEICLMGLAITLDKILIYIANDIGEEFFNKVTNDHSANIGFRMMCAFFNNDLDEIQNIKLEVFTYLLLKRNKK